MPFIDPGARATDVNGVDLTSRIVVTGSVNTRQTGTYTLTYTVAADDGRTSSTTRTVNVVDTTAPVITGCPGDITQPNDASQCAAKVNWTEPVATDNCQGVVLRSDHKPGEIFPMGTTTVTYTATDTSRNTANCSFTVTVKDTENPAITAPPAVIVSADAGKCEASGVALGTPVTADNCGVASVLNDHPSTTFPKGMTVVTWTVTDTSANAATCKQNVSVVDKEPPTIACPPNLTVKYGGVPVPATTVAQFAAQGGTISDNCDPNPAVASADSTAGTCPVVLTRRYVVTDASGNSSTCQQTIMVNNLLAADAIIWHQPLARNGMSDDTDPSAGGTLKYRFHSGNTIPVQVRAIGCGGVDVTGNANVIGRVEVLGDVNCDGVADTSDLPIGFHGVGGSGGLMDKVGGALKYNLDTSSLPQTTRCFVLKVTVTDTSTGESKSETVLLQAW